MPHAPHLFHVEHGKSSSDSLDRVVGDLAERQHGLVARRQLLALGMGVGAIEDRIARGLFRRVSRGVYAVGHAPNGLKARWMEAVLGLGPDAFLSHRSAAALWGLLPPRRIEVEVTRSRRARPRSGVHICQSTLEDDEVSVFDGIPVTSPSRTLIDLAAVSSRQQVEQAFNEAEVRGLTDRISVPELLERHPRRKGTPTLNSILESSDHLRGVTKKELERRSEMAFEHDRQRDRLLIADGWRVTRVTWRQLRDEPSAVVADLLLMLARPSP